MLGRFFRTLFGRRAPRVRQASSSHGRYKELRDRPPQIHKGATPEELCSISDDMDDDAVRERLAQLYKRHNMAAASLDANLREEAKVMLEAIVKVREKRLGN
jgi:hypothetical protein